MSGRGSSARDLPVAVDRPDSRGTGASEYSPKMIFCQVRDKSSMLSVPWCSSIVHVDYNLFCMQPRIQNVAVELLKVKAMLAKLKNTTGSPRPPYFGGRRKANKTLVYVREHEEMKITDLNYNEA